jgi:hypothetical protein
VPDLRRYARKEDVIEAPTDSQRHDAVIAHGAQMFASGRSETSVRSELKKRGMSVADIETSWDGLRNRRDELIRARRRRTRLMGICWFSLGLTMLGGIAWSMLVHGVIPLILILGLIPLAYGIYLLRLPHDQEPSIEPPRIFGRNL